ncbi:hypothetical protein GY45DRAFT_957688 [Cubamyces sp. BRFM 1775]|nr:hypothetical protein GY45DRAFT_957688 [Cubamyces sp. BRFM 1775]
MRRPDRSASAGAARRTENIGKPATKPSTSSSSSTPLTVDVLLLRPYRRPLRLRSSSRRSTLSPAFHSLHRTPPPSR